MVEIDLIHASVAMQKKHPWRPKTWKSALGAHADSTMKELGFNCMRAGDCDPGLGTECMSWSRCLTDTRACMKLPFD